MRGRKPVPTEMRVVRGNPGRRPLNDREPQPEKVENLDPPSFLDEDAKAEWIAHAPMLERLGLLTEADLDAFGIYCQTFAMWKEANRKIKQFGMMVVSNSNNGYPQVSPYVQMANKLQEKCVKLLVEFGLTPSARSRVTTRKGATKKDKQNERFFGRSRPA